MFWVDEIVEDILKKHSGRDEFIIRDEKTVSGRVHVGSLRGVAIHAMVAQALREAGRDARFIYELNDADPMDGLPSYLSKKFAEYMGMPLHKIPQPDENGEPDTESFKKDPLKNFGRFFGNEFKSVIEKLGYEIEFVWATDLWAEGMYDEYIERVMRHPETIRAIYKEVSGSEKPDDWLPLQVACEQCGKIGTTKVTEWDAEKKEVTYVCMPDLVEWAAGCGNTGTVSPFGGRAKLPWKVEWPVKWAAMHVDVEGSGKDHNAAGGSHEIGEKICKQVLETEPPYNIVYEWLLMAGGAKMSSSRGVGAGAKEISDILEPQILRFFMARTWPEKQLEFDPEGDSIPRLYDLYDEAREAFFEKTTTENRDMQRMYHFSQLDAKHADREKAKHTFLPRFSRVAFTLQIPSLDFGKEMEKIKGSKLTKDERSDADARRAYAASWLQNYATDRDKFTVQESIPESARALSAEQKAFLAEIAKLIESKVAWEGEELHSAIHGLRKNSPLEAREAFGAIYQALLGKDSGPQAGWFLDALEKEFVIGRFQEVVALPKYEKPEIQDLKTSYVIVAKEARERFAGIKLGFNVLRGAKIGRNAEAIASLQEELWVGLNFEELKTSSPRLEGFREIYRGFGVKPSKYKPSPVALITRLANGKKLPHINDAVDIYNAVAVKHQLAIGLFDLKKISLPIELKFAKGGEQFHALGEQKAVPLLAGELCYFDANGLVMARDFNHLDSELAKVTEETTDILINVDGNQNCTSADVLACLKELEELLIKHCGGQLGESVIADAQA